MKRGCWPSRSIFEGRRRWLSGWAAVEREGFGVFGEVRGDGIEEEEQTERWRFVKREGLSNCESLEPLKLASSFVFVSSLKLHSKKPSMFGRQICKALNVWDMRNK